MNHLKGLKTTIFYYNNKIRALPSDGFKDSLYSFLSGTRTSFSHFKEAIEDNVNSSELTGKELKDEILNYLIPMQSPDSRHYHRGLKNNKHYISYLIYDPRNESIYEMGFAYEAYRAFLHPDSAIIAILLGVVIFVITVGFRFFFLGTLILPLRNILNGIQKVQEGDLEVNINIKVADEIGFITQNFNEMTMAMNGARKELDEYAENLEEKVEERTKELQKSNTELTATMNVMEAMNDELVMTNKELEEAQRIAARDMEMAVYVQTSFFPKEAPKNRDWEISYIFEPMAGVSGDMYDFYTEEGKLLGLSLFDVSGHGIASGLITMIAKSIIFRRFMEMQDEKLQDIIEKVNNELIEEIGKVDNYLTGLLVRFDDNNIEFINAGHTDPIYYNAASKKVKIVDLKDNSIKGMFLGIESMKDKYKSLSFSMEKDDILLLYTDCLIESKNIENEEYGIRNIVLSLRQYKDLSSSDILEKITQDLFLYTGTDKITDDLTILLIRRLT